jgi:hypothetical protein
MRAAAHQRIGTRGYEMNKRQTKTKESDEVEARWKQFWDEHKDFESPWARNVLHQLSEFLPFVFKFEAVGHAIAQLYTGSAPCPPDWNWKEDWSNADEHLPIATLRQLPIFRLALELEAYAYHGLKFPEDALGERGLDRFLEDLDQRTTHPKFITLFPLEWGGGAMEQTISAALGRHKLDFPEVGPLKPEELAALIKLPRKNIVNLLTPVKSAILKSDTRGQISVESARNWLSRRDDFLASVWQQQQSDFAISAHHSEPLLADVPIFVPVASDGTWFSPNDRSERDGSYHVASGDREEKHENYWAALDFLLRAKFPRWRYRDAANRWRAKTGRGDDWIRKSREEIEALMHV